jgi:hypothetical protein
MAVVANRRRTGATRRPQIRQRALLADARFVPGLRRGRLWNQISIVLPAASGGRISATRVAKFF